MGASDQEGVWRLGLFAAGTDAGPTILVDVQPERRLTGIRVARPWSLVPTFRNDVADLETFRRFTEPG